ncbi:phosphotransferase [Streptomyces sp. NPDC088194]|uniref:phosphotransferase n=1 Tax=Streptomyces sp. NPDC088194 TaxID=3154931 RepID=UPI00344F9E44
MSAVPWSTHALDLRSDRVVKTFLRGRHDECGREWRALTLLDAHAPGLAPAPRGSDLTAEQPVVVMSRLPGEPLRGRPLDARRLAALAATVGELYAAVPAEVLRTVPPRPNRPERLVAQIHAWTPDVRPRVGAEVGAAMDRGLAWLAGSGLERAPADAPDVPAVFGPGDGNLANYLWDGARVRVVDFEDSGRSERPFELAEITEHAGSWVEHPLDVEAFLGRFDLGAAERVRLGQYRRLLALVWLFLVCFDDPERPRNPPGTQERQAGRLRRLLG